ncbi:MAG: TerC/Alx family metal homeostasis membrane protein [Sodalis sp. (in: enterobacteria)]
MHTVGNSFLWGSFSVIVIILLAVDLLIQGHANDKKPLSIKIAILWSLLWFLLALLFNALLWFYLLNTKNCAIANTQAITFFTVYLLEKMLAVDNVFIWLIIFRYFSIPLTLQRHLLSWGILGAIGLRSIIVCTGSWIISEFQWLLYVFGAFLLFTGIKILLPGNDRQDIVNRPLLQWLYRKLRVTTNLHGNRFFIRRAGLLCTTPLLLALIMIECSDIIFSLDSIPAIFSVTTDPFIVLTSNLFAILGLRAMYFLLANVANRFSLLKYGIAVIFMFIGIKMLFIDIIHIPAVVSLAMVVATLTITLLVSSWVNHHH